MKCESQNCKLPVGSADILLITLDTLRYDAAQWAWENGKTPFLGDFLPKEGWERRHSPASFTYAAHHAFLSGFLPTPVEPGPYRRLFASRFGGSETTGKDTFLFDEPTLPEALSNRGYQTICIGGTGFFNPENSLGRVLPNMFQHAFWDSSLGVADSNSETHQVDLLIEQMRQFPDELVFALMNVSAIHQPNWFYRHRLSDRKGGQTGMDDWWSHVAALIAVDEALGRLFSFCQQYRPAFCIICSDHGTAYGEDGYRGHRIAHPTVWDVPYSEFRL